MFSDKPKLKSPFWYRPYEMIINALLFFPAVLLQGTTVLWITSDLEISFLPAEYVELDLYDDEGNQISGMMTREGFLQDDGPGTYLTLWRTKFAIGFEDIEALLNPGAFENVEGVSVDDLLVEEDIDEDDLPTPSDVGLHVYTTESPKKLRGLLAFPFFFFGSVFFGKSLAFKITANGRLGFKKTKRVSDPEDGYIVDDEFKKFGNRGTIFERWNVDYIFAFEGIESVVNPAVVEALRSKEELERKTEKTVGSDSTDVQGTVVRSTTVVNHGRLGDYAPFSMLDGSSTRTQMNFAYEARAKHEDRNNLLYVGGLIMAFFIGSLSPRLNGSSGGGAGISVPMPHLTPPTDLIGLGIDLAAMGVL